MSISTLASLGMAIGAPLVYADQAYSIYRKQDASGFSHDVCAVLLLANITRCVFWLGERFEFALLLQSILMILAQLGLLYLCIRFRPITANSRSISSDGARVIFQAPGQSSNPSDAQAQPSPQPLHSEPSQEDGHDDDAANYPNKPSLLSSLGISFGPASSGPNGSYARLSSSDPSSQLSSTPAQPSSSTSPSSGLPRSPGGILPKLRSGQRPLNFWQWQDYASYLIFLSAYTVLFLILYLILGSSATFISLLGYLALGLESTLPIPQLIANYRRKSLAGFRPSVLVGWLLGDTFKLGYFVFRSSPAQFTVCAVFQLSIDLCILAQSHLYKQKTEEDEESLKKKAQAKQRQQRQANGSQHVDLEADVDEDEDEGLVAGPTTSKYLGASGGSRASSKGGAHSTLLDDQPQHVIQIEADEDEDEGDLANAGRTRGR